MALHHHPQDSAPEAVEHVLELLRDFETAMAVTHAREGGFHARPMAVADVESDGTTWFVTDLTSPKLSEIEADSRAMLSFQDAKRYLVVYGNIAVVKNEQKIRELWKETFKLWFENENDPNLILLRFTPRDAEYWDTSGVRGLKYAFRAVKAYVTGESAKKETDPDVHGKVQG